MAGLSVGFPARRRSPAASRTARSCTSRFTPLCWHPAVPLTRDVGATGPSRTSTRHRVAIRFHVPPYTRAHTDLKGTLRTMVVGVEGGLRKPYRRCPASAGSPVRGWSSGEVRAGRSSSTRTSATPATIRAPPSSWMAVGNSPSSSQATRTAKSDLGQPDERRQPCAQDPRRADAGDVRDYRGDQRQTDDRDQPARARGRRSSRRRTSRAAAARRPCRAGAARAEPTAMPLLAMATDGSSASTRADSTK